MIKSLNLKKSPDFVALIIHVVYSIDTSLFCWPDGYEDHREDEILSEQRHDQRRRRDDLDDQQEEHIQARQNWNGQRHLWKMVES